MMAGAVKYFRDQIQLSHPEWMILPDGDPEIEDVVGSKMLTEMYAIEEQITGERGDHPLVTMFDRRTRHAKEVMERLIEVFGDKVFDTVIPRNVRLAEAPSHGQSIVGYDRASRGGVAYLGLAGEVVRRQTERERGDHRAPRSAPDGGDGPRPGLSGVVDIDPLGQALDHST